MAGNYYHDPRPFYGLNNHNLITMDELFYGRRDPWYMNQIPYGHYEDHQRSRSADPRRPEQYVQSYDQYREYRRPDFRDDTYTNFQQNQMQQQQSGKKGNNGGGGGGGHNNNHGGGNNNNQKKQQQKRDSDSEDDDFSSKKSKNKGSSHDNNHSSKGWSDNRGFKPHHRRSQSLTQTLLKKLGLRDDTSSDSSDDERYGSRKVTKGHGGGGGHGGRGHGKADHKPYTVRFDDQSYGHGSNQKHKGVHGLGEDHDSHGSHGKKGNNNSNHGGGNNNHGGGNNNHGGGSNNHGGGNNRGGGSNHGGGNNNHGGGNNNHGGGNNNHGGGNNNHGGGGNNHGGGNNNHGGQLQGILKKPKNNNNNDGYSSDEENHGNNKNGGNSESGKKKGGQGGGKLARSQSMDFRVNLCCENCERKVKKSLRYMDDVDEVLCDQWNNRVVVVGNAKPESVLKNLRKVKKDTHVWQHHK